MSAAIPIKYASHRCDRQQTQSGADRSNHVVDHSVCDGFELFRGTVLNRVRHPDDRGVDSKRTRLRGSGRLERLSGNRTSCDAAAVESRDVVQTARRARPSVGKAYDNDVATLYDRLHDRFGRRLGVSRLHETRDIKSARGQATLDGV